jgi:tripartite ATP-independent transporter DctM subunit
LRRVEDGLSSLCLAVMVALPLAEAAARRLLDAGLPGAGPLVRHLTLWVAFLGAAIAAREGRLITLATRGALPEGRARQALTIIASAVAAGACALLARAGISLVIQEIGSGESVAFGVPVWFAQLVLPLSFALIAARLILLSSPGWVGRAVAAIGAAAGLAFGQWPGVLEGASPWPGLAVLVLAAALGAPIFAVLGGAAALLFMSEGVAPAAVLIETYALSVSPTLAAIPLFSLAGFLLAEGQASRRLVRLFQAALGWLPGGVAVAAVVLCAFFSALTGGSGVTILALGGLLLPVLREDGYPERFSIGVLTSSAALGILFPPALPLILYGVVAQVDVEALFLGGLLPGLALVALMVGWGVRAGRRMDVPRGEGNRGRRRHFNAREAASALWAARWEVLLPVVVLGALFGGIATLVESAALAALYALIVEAGVHRELGLSGLLRAFTRCAALVGGVLIILGVAVGLTSYLIDVEVPARLVAWTQDHVQSRWVFLLGLNLLLLLVGCVMDVFSAIAVVVPLIVPLAAAYGVDPVHLGVLFVANLELGYLTPPVGLNLFLASQRFERSLAEVWRAVLPALGLLALGVLLITYVPWLTLALPRLLGR